MILLLKIRKKPAFWMISPATRFRARVFLIKFLSASVAVPSKIPKRRKKIKERKETKKKTKDLDSIQKEWHRYTQECTQR